MSLPDLRWSKSRQCPHCLSWFRRLSRLDSACGFRRWISVAAGSGRRRDGVCCTFSLKPSSPSARTSCLFRHWLQDEHHISPAPVSGSKYLPRRSSQTSRLASLVAYQGEIRPLGLMSPRRLILRLAGKTFTLSDDLKVLLGSPLEIVMKGRYSEIPCCRANCQEAGGIEFFIKNIAALITSIFLHSEGDDGFREYAGELPGGLAFADPRIAVESKPQGKRTNLAAACLVRFSKGKECLPGIGTISPLFPSTLNTEKERTPIRRVTLDAGCCSLESEAT